MQTALEVPGPDQLERQQREQRRTKRTVLEARALDRLLEGRNDLIVGEARGAHEAAVVGDCRRSKSVAVGELRGDRRRVEQGLAVVAIADLALGLPEADQQVAANPWVGAGLLRL